MRDAIRTEAFQIRIASLMFVLGLCTVAVTQTATQPKNSSSSAPQAMINVLASGGPHPSLGEEAQTFDRFVGTWDGEFTSYRRTPFIGKAKSPMTAARRGCSKRIIT